MLDTPVINLLILLSFTYFVSSLILSSVNEALFGLTLRKKTLKKALLELFCTSDWQSFVQKTMLKSPHITTLIKAGDEIPAYIPSENFVLAMVEQIRAAGNYDAANLMAAINASSLPDAAKGALSDIAAQAANFKDVISVFEARLATYYNNAMDRASGWFKRQVRNILFILAFILTIAMDLDTIKIINDALRDPDKLNEAAERIVAALPNIQAGNGTMMIKDSVNSITITQQIMTDSSRLNSADPAVAASNYKNLRIQLEQTGGLHVGYKDLQAFRVEWFDNPGDFLKKIFGILITVFALQLGANYWFDVLNKVSNIRATGKRPNGKL